MRPTVRVPGYAGRVGIIEGHSRSFCGSCNRLRLDARGRLRTCLYGAPGARSAGDGARRATPMRLAAAIAAAVWRRSRRRPLGGAARGRAHEHGQHRGLRLPAAAGCGAGNSGPSSRRGSTARPGRAIARRRPMGQIEAICISRAKGTVKVPVPAGRTARRSRHRRRRPRRARSPPGLAAAGREHRQGARAHARPGRRRLRREPGHLGPRPGHGGTSATACASGPTSTSR